MCKFIKVTLDIEVPKSASEDEINNFINDKVLHKSKMNFLNPCKEKAEILSLRWKSED